MSDKAHFYLFKTFNAAESAVVRMLAPVTGNLIRAFVKSDIVMAGGNALFDVNVAGTTIWSDQTQRLKILDTAQTGNKSGLSVAVTEFQEITVDFDGFTGTAAQVGNRLALVLEFESSGGDDEGGGAVLGAMVKLNAPQAVADQEPSPGAIQWDDNGETVRDDGGFVSLDDNGFIIPEGFEGWYAITWQARWAGNATGTRRLEIHAEDPDENIFFLARNWVTGLGTTDEHVMQVSATYYLPEGWKVFFCPWQSSGGDLDVVETGDETWFSIVPAGKG